MFMRDRWPSMYSEVLSKTLALCVIDVRVMVGLALSIGFGSCSPGPRSNIVSYSDRMWRADAVRESQSGIGRSCSGHSSCGMSYVQCFVNYREVDCSSILADELSDAEIDSFLSRTTDAWERECGPEDTTVEGWRVCAGGFQPTVVSLRAVFENSTDAWVYVGRCCPGHVRDQIGLVQFHVFAIDGSVCNCRVPLMRDDPHADPGMVRSRQSDPASWIAAGEVRFPYDVCSRGWRN